MRRGSTAGAAPSINAADGTRTWIVNRSHAKADDAGPGTAKRPFATIGKAAALAGPGDVVLVRAGTYRERVAPARGGEPDRPIVYQAAPGERVVITGSDPWPGTWRPVAGLAGVYRGDLDPAVVAGFNPYAIKADGMGHVGKCLGQVIVDGVMLNEVATIAEVAAAPGTWMAVDDGSALIVHFPGALPLPEERQVEYTVRDRVFAPHKRGLGHIVVRGFEIAHCANQGAGGFWTGKGRQAGMVSLRSGHHWLIENNVIHHAKSIGLDLGGEGALERRQQPYSGKVIGNVIRDNVISDNGECGICGLGHTGTRIVGNILERNNCLAWEVMEEAAIKTHFFYDGLIEGNLIRDNDASGIWLDNVWTGTRVTRNLLLGNCGAGIFIEMGDGPLLVDNNVIGYTRAGAGLAGDGIYSHDSSTVVVAHNLLFFNANFGLWAHVGSDRTTGRGGKRGSAAQMPCSASRWQVLNNLIVGNHRGAISLPAVHERSRDNRSDFNLCAGAFDLVTSETWGAPLDQPLFIYNTGKGRVEMTQLVEQFAAAFAKTRTPGINQGSLERWAATPLLTLNDWRMLSGHDLHSLVPILLRPFLLPRDPVLGFIIDDAPARLGCPPVAGVEHDYFGRPLPAREPLPGPFQDLKFETSLDRDDQSWATSFRGQFEKFKGTGQCGNRLPLWPIPPRPADG